MISMGNICFYGWNANWKRNNMIISHNVHKAKYKYKKVLFFLQFFDFECIIEYVLYVILVWMKKILSQLWHWILKNKKKLVYGVLALIVGQICLFGIWEIWLWNDVFAEDSASQSEAFQKKANGWVQSLSFVQKVIYVFLYPALLIMGKLIDNSLVYWEVFGFDTVLWQLWNVVRNLANFALWFIFVYYIFKYLITRDSKKGPKWLIVRALIAWIWIQASWFLMAALIDVSTIVTYWVWWLPVSTLWSNTDVGNPYMLQNVVSAGVSDDDPLKFYYTDPENKHYISQCESYVYQTWAANRTGLTLLIAPLYVYYYDDVKNVGYPTEQLMCHYDGNVYRFKSLPKGNGKNIERQSVSANSKLDDLKTAQNNYNTTVNNWKWLGKENQLIEDNMKEWALLIKETTKFSTETPYGWDVDNQKLWEEWGLTRMKDLLSGDSYVWVFTTLYASLLNAWYNMRVSDANSSLYISLLNCVISVWHLIAIAIPLFAMMIVFVMRLGVLWMWIALSPVIVLMKVFEFDKDVKWTVLEYLSLENLIPIVFSPVIMCLAVSISTVLVRLIMNMNWDTKSLNSTGDFFWWLVQLSIAWVWTNLWKLLCGAIWVAITWFLVRAAVESSVLWKKSIVQSLKSLATSALWSVPIVPVIWKDEQWKLTTEFVGANAAFWDSGAFNSYAQRIERSFSWNDSRVINDLMNPEEAKKRKDSEYISNFSVSESPTGDWTSKKVEIDGGTRTFKELSDDSKQKIIEKINEITDENIRKAFWAVSKVQVWSKEYVFDGSKYK